MPESQQPQEPRTDTPDRERKRERRISLLSLAVASLALLFMAAALYFNAVSAISPDFFSGANVKGSFIKLEGKELTAFQGTLENVSSFHAHGFTLKGKFSMSIIEFEVDTPDIIDFRRFNEPPGCFEVSLSRLSKKNKCTFSAIVDKKCDVAGEVFASWGNDRSLKLKLQQADERTKKAFELGSDLSRLSRKKWLERNARNL